MKKIIRLTESDLINLVNRVTNEQRIETNNFQYQPVQANDVQTQPVKLTQDQNNKMLRKFIMDFQKTNGLRVDGIVNGQTYPLMLKQGYFR